MAGFYPDVPGPRMAYHLDGTEMYRVAPAWSGSPVQLSSMQVSNLNRETSAEVDPGANGGFVILFPELRDLSGINVGIRHAGTGTGIGNLHWSPDTTNGIDGTWTSVGFPPAGQVSTAISAPPIQKTLLRTAINPLALNGVKGLRWTVSGASRGIFYCHLYGRISNMQLDKRLRLWHPTLDEPISGHHFDFGDVARGSSGTIDFRVKNHSTEWQATDVTVGITHPTDATPTMADQLLLSTTSSPTLEGQKAIGTLAPEAISEIVTLNRNTSSTAQLSLWWSLIVAEASHWDDPDAEPES